MNSSRRKSRKRSSVKSAIRKIKKENINNNSFFEENENNLYDFIKNNKFEEFQYEDADGFINQKSGISNRNSISKPRVSKLGFPIIKSSILDNGIKRIETNRSIFDTSELIDNESLFLSKTKNRNSITSQLAYSKSKNSSIKSIRFKNNQDIIKSDFNAKMKLNRQIKNDRFFIDYKSQRKVSNTNNFFDKINFDNSDNDNDDEEKEDEKKKKKKIEEYIDIKNKEEIKDINVLTNIKKLNKKKEELNNIKENFENKQNKYDYTKVNQSNHSSKISSASLKDKKGTRKKNDYFNNNFKEDNLTKKIKKKQDIKIYDFDINNYNNTFSNQEKKCNSKNDILKNSFIYKDNNEIEPSKKIDDLIDINLNYLSNIKENDDSKNNRPSIFKENPNLLNEIVNHKIAKNKNKWKKEEQEKLLNEFKSKNAKLFNNVILFRPEIVQSQKQMQYGIFSNINYKKKNLDYINYILRKANKKEEEKYLQKKEIDFKVERFAKKMELLEKTRFNNFKKNNDRNSNSKIIINKEYSEDVFDNKGNVLNNNLLSNKKTNVSRLDEKFNLYNKSNIDPILTKNFSEFQIEKKFTNFSLIRNFSTINIKKSFCDCLIKIYKDIKGFFYTLTNFNFDISILLTRF